MIRSVVAPGVCIDSRAEVIRVPQSEAVELQTGKEAEYGGEGIGVVEAAVGHVEGERGGCDGDVA